MTERRASTTNPRSRSASESLSLAVASLRVRGDTRHADRHAGLPGLRVGSHRGFRGGRCRALCHGCLGRRGIGPRGRRRPRSDHRPGGMLLHQQVRPRERRAHGGPRRAAGVVRQQDRATAAGHRQGRHLHAATSTSCTARPGSGRATRRSRSRSRTSWPPRSLPAATSCSKPPPRLTTTSSRSSSRARTSPTPSSTRACTAGCATRSSPPCWWVRGEGHRPAGPARRLHPLPAHRGRRAAGRAPASRSRAMRSRSRPIPRGPLLVRVFKTAADPFVGRLTYLRVLSGTIHSQGHVWNADARRGRTNRPAVDPARQGPGADRRAEGGRDRRGRQARCHRNGRHAVVEGEAARPAAARVPGPDALARDRAASPRPTSTRWAPACSGCSRRSRRCASNGRRPASRSAGHGRTQSP